MTPDPSARRTATRANLAQLLGRAEYPGVAEVRRLTARGLREAPPQPSTPRPDPAPVRPPHEPPIAPPPDVATTTSPARLPRRKPGANLPENMADDPPPYAPADEAVLARVSTALRAIRTR